VGRWSCRGLVLSIGSIKAGRECDFDRQAIIADGFSDEGLKIRIDMALIGIIELFGARKDNCSGLSYSFALNEELSANC
jgi:hypothetical protein